MSGQKIIAVVGATGAQGGGLVRAILADPERRFAARAITRKTDSDKARALAAAGVEVVPGDADNPASLERAFAGAHGAFLVTNFWEHFSPDRELKQAAALARATK
ncbi:MAG TPA: NmrA family NAD(P)-binding protein, partial [Vicinamibacterales bacterium]|nr:NmrA family NAD(P)-binding protein [Vicinamibacterales bacterium]